MEIMINKLNHLINNSIDIHKVYYPVRQQKEKLKVMQNLRQK